MKLFIFLFMLSVSLISHAQCPGKVDPKNVMFFVDMNNANLEEAAAQRAACARGQKLVIIPKNHTEYNQLTSVVQNDMKAYEHCLGGSGTCDKQKATYMSSYQKLETFKAQLPSTEDQMRAELKAIKENGGKLVNLTISGHDGGGTFSGHKGETSRDAIQKVMEEYKDVNGVKSIMLLGCYTAVPNEVMHWKTIFPDAKLIAGYDGIAPASDKIAGHHYIEDILRKEKTILAQANQSSLDRYLKANVRGLSIMNTGIYTEIECREDNNKFFYGLDNTSRHMRPMDIKECDAKRAIVADIQSKLSKYYSGELEPPVDTNGELRQLYNLGRRYEHCGAYLNLEYSMSQAFNLLFYDGVKKNFAKYYADDMARAQQIIGTITPEDVTKPYIDAIAKYENDMAEDKALSALAGDKDAYLAEIAKRKGATDTELNALAEKLGDIAKGTKKPETIEEAANLQKYNELREKSITYDLLKDEMNESPADVAEYHKERISVLTQSQEQMRLSIAEYNSHPERLQVWTPTAENLAKKSRKETMENIHRLEALKSTPGISPKKVMALNWMYAVTEFHLEHMENPFSWHEYTGRAPEKPLGADNLHLDDWLKMAGDDK
jgi:hypothetical protein